MFCVRVGNGEQPASDAEFFVLLGNVPRVQTEIPADGVHLVGLEMDTELFKFVQIGASGKFVFALFKGADVLFLGSVVFVLDVADNDFQQVFDVARPDVPPYSSTTMARWFLRLRNSCNSSLAILVSGTKKGWLMMLSTGEV